MGIYVSYLAQWYIVATVQTLLYGAYIVSFGICMSILLKRRKKSYQYYLVATVILFLLVSANVLVCMMVDIANACFYEYNGEYDRCWEPIIQLYDARYETALASSSVADAILLWRCYTVWGKRRKVIIFPAFLYIATHVVGLLLSSSGIEGFGLASGPAMVLFSDSIAAISAGAVGLNNLLLSSLIAFRIFRMSREVVAYLGARPKSMYRTIIAVTLESGLLYSAFLNVLFIIGMVYTFGVDIDGASVTVLDICLRIWAPIAGLVSTTIIIRVTLGISDEMENTVIMFRATHVENEDAAVIDISRPPADLEQKGTSERLNTPELESDGDSSSSGNTNRVD